MPPTTPKAPLPGQPGRPLPGEGASAVPPDIRAASISPRAADTPMLRESDAFRGLQAGAVTAGLVTPRIMHAEEMAAVVTMQADPGGVGTDLDVTGGHAD